MKRILFVLPSLGVGGMERALITIANQLSDHGYEVTVCILDDITDLSDELDKRVRLLHKPYKSHLGQKIPYIRHKLYDDGMWEKRATPRQLYQYYVGDERFDVEIAFFKGRAVKIISGSTNRNAAHLAWVHNDYRKVGGYQSCFKNKRQVYEAYTRFDRVVCVSQQAREGFIEAVGDTGNTVTVYNMLPVSRIKALSDEKAELDIRRGILHLVIIARLLDEAKGQLRLVNAVSRLHDEGYDISLAIVGGGTDEQRIRDRIEHRSASSYITMTGSQRNPYPYIKEADLLVCASYFEGYNLTVAEALILDTPVLSTDCTGPNEILDGGTYGMIVENSEDGLYQGIKNLYEDPDLLREYGEKAKQRRDFFDEEKLLRQITDLFEG